MKRARKADSDVDMSSDADDTSAKIAKTARSMTPAQRHISA